MAVAACTMAVRLQLDDRQWAKIEAWIAANRGRGRPGKNDRNFFEAVLWWRRTGAPWRDLPEVFGPWTTVFNRFDRWSRKGKWLHLFEALKTDIDAEWHSFDSTTNRAHQHAAGAKGGIRQLRRWVGPVAATPRRSTSASMRSACPSPSRSRPARATT
jgi:transposase